MSDERKDELADAWAAARDVGFPRGVCDPCCPSGDPLDTPVDHRLLWHLETVLAVSATTDSLRDVGRSLSRYLNATCRHHWHDYDGDDDIAAHRQCLWCNDVIWLAELPETPAIGQEATT